MTTTTAFARAHTAAYVSDKIRVLLKRLVRDYGLDPQRLADAWTDWIERAARTWMVSGHLTGFVIEFHHAGDSTLQGRWDFPIRYDGNGDAELWVDDQFFEETVPKAHRPPSNCTYRILLQTSPGAPPVPGVGDAEYLSTAGFSAREAGSVIVTPDVMASARYYKR